MTNEQFNALLSVLTRIEQQLNYIESNTSDLSGHVDDIKEALNSFDRDED